MLFENKGGDIVNDEKPERKSRLEILKQGTSPDSRMGLLHKDSCCGSR